MSYLEIDQTSPEPGDKLQMRFKSIMRTTDRERTGNMYVEDSLSFEALNKKKKRSSLNA